MSSAKCCDCYDLNERCVQGASRASGCSLMAGRESGWIQSQNNEQPWLCWLEVCGGPPLPPELPHNCSNGATGPSSSDFLMTHGAAARWVQAPCSSDGNYWFFSEPVLLVRLSKKSRWFFWLPRSSLDFFVASIILQPNDMMLIWMTHVRDINNINCV